MKVSSVQYNSIYNTYPIQNNAVKNKFTAQTLVCDKPPMQPAFYGIDLVNNLNPTLLFKLKNYTLAEYSTLSELEKRTLRSRYKDMVQNGKTKYWYGNEGFYNNLEVIHDYIANAIKTNFDKKYGKDKYIVIAIGRSLSSISKVLGYKIGEENVKNIPLSDAQKYKIDANINKARNSDDFPKFIQYLNSMGLSQKDITKSNKKYILIDFCLSGQSLNGAQNLFHSLFGNKRKIVTEDPIKYVDNPDVKKFASNYLRCCEFKDYSFVKKSRGLCTEKMEINPRRAKSTTKLVWFKLLDNEATGANYKDKPLMNDMR